MKIGFDISQTAHQGGVSTYTQSLAEELLSELNKDIVFFYSSLRRKYKGNLKNVKSFRLPPTLFEVLFNKMRNVPIEQFIGPVDIFHSSDWIQPPTKALKVTTYHDVIPLLYPKWSHPKIVEVHKTRLKIVEREIDMVIAVSNQTKKDLLRTSSIPEHKITVVYEGVDKKFKKYPEEQVENFRKKYNLPQQFILSIGGIGERRNIENIKKAASGYELIITGESIPFLPEDEMPLLYNAAQMLLYPSFYEGFGLPVLEAMASGIPVVTSNVSSLPEVGGEAVVYVSPDNLDAITKAVKSVVTDQALREELIKKGFVQAKKFTWEQCAQQTIEVYKGLLK